MFLRSFRLVYWGIGTSGSYTRKFGSASRLNSIRHLMGRLSDANIVYSDFPVARLEKAGVAREKIFVANNTVSSAASVGVANIKKRSILFLGSLYREKRVDDLIVAYSEVRDELGHDIPHVDIVGDGQDMPRLRQLVSELKLDPLVTFHGAVFDEQSLGAYLRKAIVCVSPGQAGLSVLKAMSFGVCFVTSREAITGGEILNIRDGVTGVLLSDKQHLTSVLREAADEPAFTRNREERQALL